MGIKKSHKQITAKLLLLLPHYHCLNHPPASSPAVGYRSPDFFRISIRFWKSAHLPHPQPNVSAYFLPSAK